MTMEVKRERQRRRRRRRRYSDVEIKLYWVIHVCVGGYFFSLPLAVVRRAVSRVESLGQSLDGHQAIPCLCT